MAFCIRSKHLFGFFNRNNRQASAFASDEQLKESVLAAREQIQRGGTTSLSVPDAIRVLRRFMRVEDAIDALTAFDCEYHDCTFTVYWDANRNMWFIQVSRSEREPVSPYDPCGGYRLLAWIWEFRNTHVDQRNLCARGYVSWDPDQQ